MIKKKKLAKLEKEAKKKLKLTKKKSLKERLEEDNNY